MRRPPNLRVRFCRSPALEECIQFDSSGRKQRRDISGANQTRVLVSVFVV